MGYDDAMKVLNLPLPYPEQAIVDVRNDLVGKLGVVNTKLGTGIIWPFVSCIDMEDCRGLSMTWHQLCQSCGFELSAVPRRYCSR